MIFEPWFKSWIVAIITSTFGLIAIISSPARDDFANFSILMGFVLLEINLVLYFVLKNIKLLEPNGELILSIFAFSSTIMGMIGLLFGRFLAAWTPFQPLGLPFSYYLWISFMIAINFLISINWLYMSYQDIRKVKQVQDSEMKLPDKSSNNLEIKDG